MPRCSVMGWLPQPVIARHGTRIMYQRFLGCRRTGGSYCALVLLSLAEHYAILAGVAVTPRGMGPPAPHRGELFSNASSAYPYGEMLLNQLLQYLYRLWCLEVPLLRRPTHRQARRPRPPRQAPPWRIR